MPPGRRVDFLGAGSQKITHDSWKNLVEGSQKIAHDSWKKLVEGSKKIAHDSWKNLVEGSQKVSHDSKKWQFFGLFSWLVQWALFTRFGPLLCVNSLWAGMCTSRKSWTRPNHPLQPIKNDMVGRTCWLSKNWQVPIAPLGWIAGWIAARAHWPTKENRQKIGIFWESWATCLDP